MTQALILGLLAAAVWGMASMLSAPSSRILGVTGHVWWLSLAATLAGTMLALVVSGSPRVATRDVPYLAVAALLLLAATYLWSLLVKRSAVSVSTPIVACDGAIAASIAVLTGHHLPGEAYLGLAAMVAGLIVMSRRQTAERPATETRHHVERPLSPAGTVALATLTACCFGGLFFFIGQIEGTPALWSATLLRGSVTVVAIAMAVGSGIAWPRTAGLRFAVTAGALDVSGFALYLAGARHDLAVAAVAASQYGAVGVFASMLYLRERLTRRQWMGAAALAVGAAVVAAWGQ